MSSTPVPSVPDNVVDDTKRPYKFYVAAVLAIAITVVQVVQAQWADGSWTREDTVVTLLAFLSAALVYTTENPKVFKASRASGQA
jgi:hypothetical protein